MTYISLTKELKNHRRGSRGAKVRDRGHGGASARKVRVENSVRGTTDSPFVTRLATTAELHVVDDKRYPGG
jgi:hypothetical protein